MVFAAKINFTKFMVVKSDEQITKIYESTKIWAVKK